jgi:putative FmdB family regulatory protein
MPIYEYSCNKCKTTFSLIQKIGTSEKETACSQCGSKEVKKKFSLFSSSTSKSSVGPSPSVPIPNGGT